MNTKQKQLQLRDLGYYFGSIDGSFGPATKEATKTFQRDFNLKVDGSFGPATENKSIEVIKEYQGYLNKILGAGLRIDGYAGSKTEYETRHFQEVYGITINNKLDYPTRVKILEVIGGQPVSEKAIFPVKTYIQITQGFKSSHLGIDMGYCSSSRWNSEAVQNKVQAYDGVNHKIIASLSGKVIEVRKNYTTKDSSGSSYGNYILIEHANGVRTLYAHLLYGGVFVNVGDVVAQGQEIALMGTTGHSSGVHLHFEYRINNVKQNPLNYLYAKNDQALGSNIIDGTYKIMYL